MKELSPTQRKKVEARAAELIAEEMTLRQLRHARKLTQVKMTKKLGVTQDSVSRLEKRSDLLLSTLRKTVEAMGGNLSLVAEFSDREPVICSAFPETNRQSQQGEKRASRAARIAPCSCHSYLIRVLERLERTRSLYQAPQYDKAVTLENRQKR